MACWHALLHLYFIFAFRRTSDRHKKDTIKFLLLGFVSTAVLSLTNTPAIYGYEIYPLGTFTFIPLLLLAYGLFKYNLRIALQQLRAILFTAGHLLLVVGAAFVPAIFSRVRPINSNWALALSLWRFCTIRSINYGIMRLAWFSKGLLICFKKNCMP
ncbi:MAG: hypothetical protein R2861_01380 [Desulfobacterales bacterium]